MTQIPIISGIYADADLEFRTAYPRNMVPVPKAQGISNGYLHIAEGIRQVATTPGFERGGIVWDGILYRVRGNSLVSIDPEGVVVVIGTISGDLPVSMDYSFDHLAIAADGRFWLYDGVTLEENTDPDLGDVFSVVWVSGYFALTDGESIIVTELGDPFTINPLKYGSSEIDPDPIVALHEIRNELYAVNRNTIEVFRLTGGTGFPFQRINGAQITRGAAGKDASTVFADRLAFVGSERNEALGVFLGVNGAAAKISTREIDTIFEDYTDDQMAAVWVEARADRSHTNIYIHLPDQTLVYDGRATETMGLPVWYSLSGGLDAKTQYPARGMVYAYGGWTHGNPAGNEAGVYVRDIATLYGAEIRWDFSTMAIYNESKGAIIHELELVCLTGGTALGEDPVVATQFSPDGVVWSQPRTTRIGKQGDRGRRIRWYSQGAVNSWRVQRFYGTSDSPLSPTRLEARVEGLGW